MTIIRYCLFVSIFISNYCVQAQREKFDKLVYEADSLKMPYRLLTPNEVDTSQKYPIVLYFHGLGVRGDDNEKTLLNGVWHLAKDEMQDQFPAYVLVPQCPTNLKWSNYSSTKDPYILEDEISLALKTAYEILKLIIETKPIDSNRIYVSGMSMGAYATWEIIMRFPNVFAAAVPVCGGGDTSLANKITHIPIWAFHGDLDKIVPPIRSLEMVDLVNSEGGQAKISILTNSGHDIWHEVYEMNEMYKWLFSQYKRKEY